MKVSLELPDRVWGRLTSLAETQGMTVADLIGDAVAGLLPAPVKVSPLDLLQHELRLARADGWRAPRRGTQ